MTTYRIVRFYADPETRNKTTRTGLTLEEAQRHCSRDDTHGGFHCCGCGFTQPNRTNVPPVCPKCESTCTGRAWFDGYTKE